MPKELEEDLDKEDVYKRQGWEELEEAEEISPEEEGFMEGYAEGEKIAKCAMCDKILLDEFVEREIDDEVYRFCSNRCVDKYIKKLSRKK